MNDDGVRHDLSKKKRRHDETTTLTEPSKSEIEIQGDIVRTAFERAFLLTDIRSRVDGILTSGATVACCVIIPNYSSPSAKEKIGRPTSISVHAANAGDARAVLSSTTAMRRPRRISSPRSSTATVSTDLDNNNDRTMTTITTTQKHRSTISSVRTNGAVRITNDHKSTDPDEVARIEKSGGIVMRGRVLGVLAVARSLGDHGLKEYVIGRPYVSSTVVHINDGDNCPDDDEDYQIGQEGPYTDGEFVIVACDGLWDVMKDQEAVDLVRGYVRGGDDNDNNNSDNGGEKLSFNNSRMKGVSSFLIEEALRRGSADNITVILCWL
jgi:serine/threonine protein phosphatase PrpC